ncbi:MAG: ATP-binding protein [Caldilineaceae bacterium]
MIEALRTWFFTLRRSPWRWQQSLQRRIIISYGVLFLLVLALLMLRLGLRVYRAQIGQAEHELEVKAFLTANSFEDPLSNFSKDFVVIEQWEAQLSGETGGKIRIDRDDQDSDNALVPTVVSAELAQSVKDRLQQSALQLATRAGARVTILSAQGEVIATSVIGVASLPNQRNQPEVDAALNGNEQHDIRLDSNHEQSLFTAAPVRNNGEVLAIVQLSQPMSEISAPNRVLEGELIITAVLAMLLVTVVGVWNGHRMLRPVEELTQAAIAISQGNLQHQAPVNGDDEIATLARTFNGMVSNLRTMIEQQRLFVANASHELRTPIFNIKLRSEALLSMGADERTRAQRFLTEIDNEVDRLGRMANSLLDLSRLESTQVPVNASEPINIAEVLLQAAQSMRMRIRQAGLTFVAQIPEEIELVAINATDLETLILNLLDNAIKYTPEPGSIHLTVEKGDSDCHIMVQDSGVGIPAEDLPHIFDRFYRADKARSRARGQKGIGSGAGLGLSIVKELVERNRGKIQVTSQVEVGTTFILNFPLYNPTPVATTA